MAIIKSQRYRASDYFDTSFPFSITRQEHTAIMYNEKTLHQREFWKVVYVESGCGSKIINDHTYPFNAGSLFLIHPDDITSYIINSQSIKIFNVIFLPDFLGEGLSRLTSEYQFFSIFNPEFHPEPRNTERLYVLNGDARIKDIFPEMFQEFRRKRPNYQIMLQVLLMELLIRMGRKGIKSTKKYSRENITAYIDHFIAQNFRDDINLDMLAAELEIDKTNLCRLYKQLTGTTIIQHLLQTRLRRSCEILIEDKLPISDACYGCGFNDLSYFYRTFKKHVGITPRQYRQNKGLLKETE